MKRHVLALSLYLSMGGLAVAPRCRAEGTSSDKAAAEALFGEGVSLVASGDFTAGCGKFEASQALDPTLGTTLRLADCYERAGRTASSWALWKQAEGVAHRQGEGDRESLARERAQAIQPKLSYLTVKLEGAAPVGLAVQRNGETVPLPSLGVAIPVDPGPQELSASAPDRVTWNHHLDVLARAGTTVVQIPALRVAPRRLALVAPGANGAQGAAHSERHTQRVIGVAATITGAAALLAGAGFAWYANHENNRSRQDIFCPTDSHNGCTPGGVTIRERAQSFARASTITLAAGAAVTGFGIVLWSTAPKRKEQAASAAIRLTATGSPSSVETGLVGAW